jgi:hypothetical protein
MRRGCQRALYPRFRIADLSFPVLSTTGRTLGTSLLTFAGLFQRKPDAMQKENLSTLYVHAALARARKLPVGPSRNDLRQLAIGLRWLDKKRLVRRLQACCSSAPPPKPARTCPTTAPTSSTLRGI